VLDATTKKVAVPPIQAFVLTGCVLKPITVGWYPANAVYEGNVRLATSEQIKSTPFGTRLYNAFFGGVEFFIQTGISFYYG